MCGIIGAFDPKQRLSDKEFIVLRDRMTHRGPDDAGYYQDPDRPVQLGHRRLSIIDLSEHGHQPMSNEDRSLWLVFNGEIYNFKTLRRELAAHGYRFQSNSDSEVILHGYAHWGDDVVAHLQGMFAFAVYDRRRERIFLARDRVGIKPIFYSLADNSFAFASELGALLPSPFTSSTVDPTALLDALVFGYICAPKTAYQSIRRLAPGHRAVYSLRDQSFHLEAYWDFDFTPRELPTHQRELEQACHELFQQTVRSHCISDVPLGVFLSGGIDSSFVAAHMARNGNESLRSFSIGFPEKDFNELPLCRLMAQRYHTQHYEAVVDLDKMKERFESVYAYFTEPFTDPSAVPVDFLCELARPHMTVALSGDGGDELFVGYRRYLKMHYLYLLQRVPAWQTLVRTFQRDNKFWLHQKSFVNESSLSRNMAYSSARAKMSAAGARQLLHPEWQQRVADYDPYETDRTLFQKALDQGCDLLGAMRYVDAKTWLPEDILTKVDRVSMHHSLEVRVPFLDHNFVEFVQGLPTSFLVGTNPLNPKLKKSLKAMAMPDLPAEHFSQPKRGFAMPIREWFRKRDYSEAAVLGNKHAPLFRDSEIKTLIDLHSTRKKDFHEALWVIKVVKNWYHHHTE